MYRLTAARFDRSAIGAARLRRYRRRGLCGRRLTIWIVEWAGEIEVLDYYE
jgi:hypothetical protein